MPDFAKIDSTLHTLTLIIGAGDNSPETLEVAEKLTAAKEQYMALHTRLAIGEIMERIETGAPEPPNATLTAPHARTHHVVRIRRHIKKRRCEGNSDDEIREELSKLNGEASGAGFNAKDHPLGKIAKAAFACDDATIGRIFLDLDDDSDASADANVFHKSGNANGKRTMTTPDGPTRQVRGRSAGGAEDAAGIMLTPWRESELTTRKNPPLPKVDIKAVKNSVELCEMIRNFYRAKGIEIMPSNIYILDKPLTSAEMAEVCSTWVSSNPVDRVSLLKTKMHRG